MSMPVLVATDLTSRSDRVVERCLILKRPVILAHVAGGQNDLSDELTARLENIAREDLPDADRVPEIVILKGQVPEALASYAAERGCTLIATGIASFDSPKDYIFGTTVDYLVRSAVVPVLVVKRKARGEYRNLIVATDFSGCSRRALECGAQLFPDAQIRLLHACSPPFPAFLDPEEMTPYVVGEREADMREFLKLLPSDVRGRVEPQIVVGSLAVAIEEHRAAGRCDLLVLGTHGRSGFDHALFGSRASEHLAYSLSDVLMVREP